MVLLKTQHLQREYVTIQKDNDPRYSDEAVRSRAIFRKDDVFVPRHLLSLPRRLLYFKNITIPKMTDRINSVTPLKADKRQDTVDDCLNKHFLKAYNQNNKNDSTLVALTPRGREFCSLSFMLVYMIEELGIMFSFLGAVLVSLTVGGNRKLDSSSFHTYKKYFWFMIDFATNCRF